MNVMLRFMLAKMAAESIISAPTEIKSTLQQAHDMSTGKVRVSKQELGNVKKTLKQLAPKTEKEKTLEELSGRPFTKGQYKRYAALAGTAGIATHFGGRAIGGGTTPWIHGTSPAGVLESSGKRILRGLKSGETMISPRQLARAAVIGGIYGAMIPAWRRIADTQAAKKGKF